MSERSIEALISLVERKNQIDQNATWSNGSSTYQEEIKNELEEVQAEIGQNRVPALEEELGDVLWDYLNWCVVWKRKSRFPSIQCYDAPSKYRERIDAIESGGTWKRLRLNKRRGSGKSSWRSALSELSHPREKCFTFCLLFQKYKYEKYEIDENHTVQDYILHWEDASHWGVNERSPNSCLAACLQNL